MGMFSDMMEDMGELQYALHQKNAALARVRNIHIVGKAICKERCAFKGEPPCYEVGEWPAAACDDPGCEALAKAVIIQSL